MHNQLKHKITLTNAALNVCVFFFAKNGTRSSVRYEKKTQNIQNCKKWNRMNNEIHSGNINKARKAIHECYQNSTYHQSMHLFQILICNGSGGCIYCANNVNLRFS